MKLQRGLLRQTVMAWFLHGAFICFPSACVASCTHFLVSGSQFAMTQPIFKTTTENGYWCLHTVCRPRALLLILPYSNIVTCMHFSSQPATLPTHSTLPQIQPLLIAIPLLLTPHVQN